MILLDEFHDYVINNNLGTINKETSFKQITSLKIGGNVALFFRPYNVISLQKAIVFLASKKIPYYVIGNGTNILASDEYFPMVIINLKYLNKVIEGNNGIFTIEAGVSAICIGTKIAKKGYCGSESMAIIPGTIGGVIYMNASAYKQDVCSKLKQVEYIDERGKLLTINDNFEFQYRNSVFQKHKWIITKAVFAFDRNALYDPYQKILKYWQEKRITQPLATNNAGSVFKNNALHPTWVLIDSVDLRGFTIGEAMVSTIHTNFFINKNNASFNDMKALIIEAKKRVYDKYQITLECEWKILEPVSFT